MSLLQRVMFLGSVSLASGCGASIQAVYEGDVRFEHCMALDAQPEIATANRRDCWVEWVTYYTYGQTRDRVAHAHLRIQQLDAGGELIKSSAVDEDGVVLPRLGKSVSRLEIDANADGRTTCVAECRRVNQGCMTDCQEPGSESSCRPGCEAGLRQCERQCE